MLRPPPLYELSVAYSRQPLGKEASGSASGSSPPGGLPGRVPSSKDPKSEQQQLRRKINSRERKRMQDLNLAMDALREVILPYSAAHCQSSPGRKLSKIATLLLARNYILLLGSSLQELRRILAEMSSAGGGGAGGSGAVGAPRLLLAAGLPLFAPGPVLLTGPGNVSHHHHHHHHDAATSSSSRLRPSGKYLAAVEEPPPQQIPLAGGGAAAPSLCACAVCKFPHLVPSSSGLGFAATVQAQFAK